MEIFSVELAGVPVEIRCRYQENITFLREYLTEKEPLFTVAPGEEDLLRMQGDFDRMDRAEGIPPHRRGESFLENNAIHGLLAEKLTEYGVLLMHGSALCMDGEGYLFTARSGTGKSTHARLWREIFGERVWMINDDKPMLKITNEGAIVYGTPWDGKHHLSRNACAPLKAIVKLERETVNHIEPLSKADAFPVLMQQAFCSKNPATMTRVLELEKMLLDRIAFYTMGCNMEPEAACVAWSGMQRQKS